MSVTIYNGRIKQDEYDIWFENEQVFFPLSILNNKNITLRVPGVVLSENSNIKSEKTYPLFNVYRDLKGIKWGEMGKDVRIIVKNGGLPCGC